MEYWISEKMIEEFRAALAEEEKARMTIEKYLRDLRKFQKYMEDRAVTKAEVVDYKNDLLKKYAPSSVNSMLEAVHSFLKRFGLGHCTVKLLKIEREPFRQGERELSRKEYLRLLREAGKKKGKRLQLILETLGATGIRIGELRFVTVKALQTGRVEVRSKGKERTVLLPSALCKKLKQYVRSQNKTSGSVFVTKSGKPVDRSNIWHEMKQLGEAAGIGREKVFPHNLRHLFAVTYYAMTKDLPHLADLLGHANINTTRIYTRISSGEQKKQIEALGLLM